MDEDREKVIVIDGDRDLIGKIFVVKERRNGCVFAQRWTYDDNGEVLTETRAVFYDEQVQTV